MFTKEVCQNKGALTFLKAVLGQLLVHAEHVHGLAEEGACSMVTKQRELCSRDTTGLLLSNLPLGSHLGCRQQ